MRSRFVSRIHAAFRSNSDFLFLRAVGALHPGSPAGNLNGGPGLSGGIGVSRIRFAMED
jgi:hypothetical protein